jgi:hypothetical protein
MNSENQVIAAEAGSELEKLILAKAAKNFYSRTSAERFDLFPFYSILVSTGTNKNTDHFDASELIKARHSPIDKPVNIDHNQTRIVGHIMDCIAVDADMKPIPEDISEGDIPERLHIVTSAVIYRIWEDAKVQAEVDALIDEVSKGTIFVSMEALFTDFAYLLTNATTNERKIIPRNNQTSGLTKYLRQYKGPGKIHDYSLARVLKNITFSAVGIVRKPANPDSIISANLDLFSKVSASEPVYINIDCSTNTEKTMADINVKDSAEYKDLASAYATLQINYDLLKKDNVVIHNSVAEQKTLIDSTLKTLATVQDELAAVKSAKDEKDAKDLEDAKATITKLETSKAELATANDALNATIDEFKKASRHSNRAEAMMAVDSNLTRETALQSVAKYDELSDASFAAMVEMMKGYASRAPKEVTAETVLATAKVETVAPMGVTPESNLNKASADIKNWYANSNSKKES